MKEDLYITHELCKYDYSDIRKKSFDERYTDTPMRNDEIIALLNSQEKKIAELQERNNRQYERLKKITNLIINKEWDVLSEMAEDIESLKTIQLRKK